MVPTWIRPASVPDLSYLHLVVEHEQREDIQILGTLPCLTYLHFAVRCPGSRRKMERCLVGPNAFPRLVKCGFYTVGGQVIPRMFQEGAMPRLQEFTFQIKYEESTVDDMVLSHLPSLRDVTIYGLARDLCKRNDRANKLRVKLEHEAAGHPNHPSINFKFYNI
jgi:disease resistance protein RPM1